MYKCGQKQQKRAAPAQEIVWVGAGGEEGKEGRRGSQSTKQLQEIIVSSFSSSHQTFPNALKSKTKHRCDSTLGISTP